MDRGTNPMFARIKRIPVFRKIRSELQSLEE